MQACEMSDANMFHVVILSARAINLIPCVQSVLANEPTLSPQNIIIVDDGARDDAESILPEVRWIQGERPFIFARNANIGIRVAESDVILLNDDAKLLTHRGLSNLAEQTRKRPNIGVCSAGIIGNVGNPLQLFHENDEYYLETWTLAFVCVYISKNTYQRVGLLNEQFIGYGFEDNDYCERVLLAGLELGVWGGCLVDHSGKLSSTYRIRSDIQSLFQHNLSLFRSKWRTKI